MDIFKGIGDFFGGLFGQKKKREDEQPQPQQQQSAVSFNSTPKLGDNFANNSSNPTQPQQPKEFAKSSVDLNPVKPVQPVQPQPQVNRDQERQQLADKYRQEETDRYNQGSDHAANFLNDIFSGGKTAQMRENTINQNIQNRVNAEMLRKYGPDDQQVKQNIAQTSQDINNKATSVNDFTKNYNNTVQQTVASPVSAVKGAANSVVETMPKVSGAVTELGFTAKLSDGQAVFSAKRGNLITGALSKETFTKAYDALLAMTDSDGEPIFAMPTHLIVGTKNRAAAEKILKAMTGANGETNTDYKAVELIVDPRITDTTWALVAAGDGIMPLTIAERVKVGAPVAKTDLNSDRAFETDVFSWGLRGRFDAAFADVQRIVASTGK